MNNLQPTQMGACEIRGWELRKMRIKRRALHLVTTVIYGKHLQWLYWKYLRAYNEPNTLPFKEHLFWLSNGFWSYICGSEDLALEYFIRTFFPSYKSRKWRTNSSKTL